MPGRRRRARACTDLGFETAFAVLGVHRWGFHTVDGTLERVDARLVVSVLQAHQRAIELIVSESMSA